MKRNLKINNLAITDPTLPRTGVTLFAIRQIYR
jgi:hypothetical protein